MLLGMDAEQSAMLSAIASVASALIALAAMVVAVVATRANRDSAKAADRSANAADRSAEVAEQVLAMARQVRWKLTKNNDDRVAFVLSNVGGAVAYGVELSGAKIILTDNVDRLAAIGPDEGVSLRSAIPMNAKEFSLIVTWFDNPDRLGDKQVWKHSLL